MTLRGTFLWALGLGGLALAALVPVAILRGDSQAVPGWTAAALPGPLSTAHAFLGDRCEACHTPFRGAGPETCLACHAANAPNLLTKPATAFHAEVTTCASCHVEHLGANRRPVAMDHAALLRAGRAGQGDIRAWLDRVGAGVADGVADLAGGAPGRRAVASADASRLYCAACHAVQDPHRSLFGTTCQACHSTASWRVGGYLHPSAASRDCVQCHVAPPSHYMMHFEMMSRPIARQEHARVEQCFLCHQTDAWNNIRGVGWRKVH